MMKLFEERGQVSGWEDLMVATIHVLGEILNPTGNFSDQITSSAKKKLI
jgi:hypothetical protein